jgi:aerobic carbon-monoxide dehydrogenase small subunit
VKVALNINGEQRVAEVEPRRTLLDTMREEFGLVGTRAGCEHGVCGACTVLMDGAPVRSCLIFAVQADGYEIVTIEGLAPEPGELSLVQDAFCETHALQCGYCTPGMILTAHALLQNTQSPTRDDIVEAISANICRCTGYGQIVEAIEIAAERLRTTNRPVALKFASGTDAAVGFGGGPDAPHDGGVLAGTPSNGEAG